MSKSTDDSLTKAVAATDAIDSDTPVLNKERKSVFGSSRKSVSGSSRKSIVAQARDSIIDQARRGSQHVVLTVTTSVNTFQETYGKFGYGMLIIFSLSTIWTLVLAAIQVAPVAMANGIMNTTEYDQGEFWLLPVADLYIEVLSTIALLLFAIGYLGLVALMLFPNLLYPVRPVQPQRMSIKKVIKAMTKQNTHKDGANVGLDEGEVNPVAVKLKLPPPVPQGISFARLKYELLSPKGLLRHYYAALMDGPKLIFQTTTLFLYLNNGFPIPIIYIYSSLLFINWTMSAIRYQSRRPDPHYLLTRIFYSFDLFFAVFAPLEVLTYAYFNFNFDRAEFQTRIDTIPPARYDNVARFFADPEQVSVFRIAFKYLHFYELQTLLIKCALNVLSLYKWKKAIVHLIEHQRHSSVVAENKATDEIKEHKTIESKNEIRGSKTQEWREHIQNIIIALVFFFAGLGIFIYSIVAVETTRNVCDPYHQCIIPSYQWNAGSKYCSCLIFVDREIDLKTFYEWEHRPDVTANLTALSMTGHLRIIQLINRAVPEFPIPLRNCTHLEQIILIYTETTRFPEWIGEFSQLEYLHIEGDFTPRRMTYMPLNMFQNMSKLTFIHFGVLVDLPALPDLTPLHQLRYLTLAVLHSVRTPPDLSGLTNLKTLVFVESINLQTMPSIYTLPNLQSIHIFLRQPSCCNGYLSKGVCDLTNWSCKPRPDEPPVQCLTEQWPQENWDRLKTVPVVNVCNPNAVFYNIVDTSPSPYLTDVLCGGVKFKSCTVGNYTGICYNSRMMVVSCDMTGIYENFRRLQIERKVGPPCDPIVEGWLGCQG